MCEPTPYACKRRKHHSKRPTTPAQVGIEAKQPDSAALSTAELALKSWSLFAVACWPRCSDGARLVRSSIKFSGNGEVHFRYKGTKNLKVPILGPQLGIPADQADPKVCVARCMKAYLDPTAHFA